MYKREYDKNNDPVYEAFPIEREYSVGRRVDAVRRCEDPQNGIDQKRFLKKILHGVRGGSRTHDLSVMNAML